VVLSCENRLLFSGTDRASGTPELPASSRKICVMGGHRCSSGRNSSRTRRHPAIQPSLRFSVYESASGRLEWPNRDPIQEKGGLNVFGFVRNNPEDTFDKLGLASWVWDAPQTVDYSISYTKFTGPRYTSPPTYVNDPLGYAAAEAIVIYKGGVDKALWDHYFSGGGEYDLTSNAKLEGEIKGYLAPNMTSAEDDIRKQVESFKCPGSFSLFGNSVSALGDTSFSPIVNVPGFRSSIFSIHTADAGLSKQCNAIVVCFCNGEKRALIICDFHMYFYDQYADAEDPKHKVSGAQEFIGGTEFDEIGAWGRKLLQIGTYR